VNEQLTGDAYAEERWRPLALGSFFTEGWFEPWAGGPAALDNTDRKRFADAYATALGGARTLMLPDAGHWPWLDRPEVLERVASFVGGA